MEIREFFSSDNKGNWIAQMKNCDWGAGRWLGDLLERGALHDTVGNGALVPMLTDGQNLVSFCTFAPRDEIWPTELTPWIGFVYTYPEYRGQRNAGIILDYCECIATIMGKENVYISTDHVGLYEKYGYEFLNTQDTPGGEKARVYCKSLQVDSEEKNIRMAKGGKWKAEIVKAAKKDLDMTAICGFSCNHCFLGQWCGGCRSFFNCCSYGTLHEMCVCPNVSCCKERGFDGCYECPEIEKCRRGFYANGNDGNAAKAQALFIRKYGKEEFFCVHDNLHKKYDFEKTQEILGNDIFEGLRILEENRGEYR